MNKADTYLALAILGFLLACIGAVAWIEAKRIDAAIAVTQAAAAAQPEPRPMTPEEFEAYESARKNMHRETSTRLAIDAAARRGVADGMEQARREAQGASK